MQIHGLLPKLDGTEYVIAPSLHQLANLARSGGASELKQVQSFMVEHKTWGSVRWLEPVDVRGLALKDLVTISKNSIEVSLDIQSAHHCVHSFLLETGLLLAHPSKVPALVVAQHVLACFCAKLD